MIRRFELRRRDVANWFEQPPVIEPVDPFQRCVLHGFQMPPGAATVNDLGLVETDDGLLTAKPASPFRPELRRNIFGSLLIDRE